MLDILFGSQKSVPAGPAHLRTRRQMLRVGCLAPLGLSLSHLLASRADGAEAAPPRKAKSVIMVYLGGGMSHHDTFDPKPKAAEEVRGKYGVIDTNVVGCQISEKLPKMAQCMDKVALVRGGAHNNDHHETATNWVMSGRFGSPFGDYPAVGAVVAHETGFSGLVPPYVAVPQNPSFTWELGRSAFLGGRYESFKAGDPNSNGYKVRDLARQQTLSEPSLVRRKNLLSAVDSLARQVQGNDQIATYDEFQKRAAEMILSPEAQASFDIEREKLETRDRYGRTTFGQSCLLARRLVEGGVTFVTVNYGGWDHHGKIFEGLDKKLPEFDQGFSALIEDLHTRGLLDETLVVCMGEFGRSPKINKDAGRDHWGPAASLLFAGAGVNPGQVIGATDDTGGYVVKDPASPADVAATIYTALGISPRKQIYTPDGRPLEILDSGERIHALYS
ncbi:protein of unknown function DUF1501 [Pirellula staleyi DSM 6068]|uniref:DUF1501 domain-containing protein n=1 Tax=Pirellula staleyi (strain ATCC 27377 / DSM 6068 / ICPB 4128) TaxID=530564 RepID=D2R347_PIRSD|nr:DUF1501 domain-containing protein [Pirellula staleyi]ADB18780.1 protein of unknown function DUF1501 [Pirellula staleyi DSM 6068]